MIKFAKLISNNSNTQVIVVNNEKDLKNYLKKDLMNNEIIIGMGAGKISKWITGLKNFSMTLKNFFSKKNLMIIYLRMLIR